MPAALHPEKTTAPSPSRMSASAVTPRFLFISLSLLALLALTLSPATRAHLGISDHGKWFLDSYAVLASSDANQAGIAADAPNPFDFYHRSHKYSDWWFGLSALGLTRADNFLVGGTWVLVFLAAVFLTVKRASHAEALWTSLLVCSPPVLLGILRANNDLVIFALLAVTLCALRKESGWGIALAIGALGLATGLKFYPAAAGFVLLAIPAPRKRAMAVLAGVVVLTAVLVNVAPQMRRGAFHIEPEIYTFGARILPMDWGAPERPAVVGAAILFAAAGVVVAFCGWLGGLGENDAAPGARPAMAMGSALLVACFLSAINFGYRWIFSLWLALWLWANRHASRAARLAVWLLPFCLWHDGALCWATDLWFPHLKPEQSDRVLVVWRRVTEPATWCLMVALGGWMIELLLARYRELRPARGGANEAGM